MGTKGWRSKLKKGLAFVGAAVLCPCHLPLVAALLAGTALGAYLTRYFIVIFALFSLGFVGALIYLFRALNAGPQKACEGDRCASSLAGRSTQDKKGADLSESL